MKRIYAAGGYVSLPPAPGLSARVWLDPHCTQIGLAMARSIGDHAVSAVGVIAEPVVTKHKIAPNDEFLILASDGVWEFISSQEAVDIVGEHLDRGATKACQALIEAAAAKWHEEEGDYRDDITALVVCLQDLWTMSPTSTTTK
jgi:protein phosphatase 2C family protein 2/3